jgi:hypothetical protein
MYLFLFGFNCLVYRYFVCICLVGRRYTHLVVYHCQLSSVNCAFDCHSDHLSYPLSREHAVQRVQGRNFQQPAAQCLFVLVTACICAKVLY